MADQAIASLGNFARNIILTHYLSTELFGAYGVLILPVFLLLASFHAAIVIYPLQVKGAALAPGRLRAFSSICTLLTLVVGIVLALVMGVCCGWASVRAGAPLIATSTLGAAMLLLFLLQELYRRALMARLRFAAAIPGDAVSYLGQVGILAGLGHLGYLHGPGGLPAALAVMAGFSLLGALIQSAQVGLGRFTRHDLLESAREFWRLGKWVLAANLMALITDLPYNWIIGLHHELESGAHFRVISDLMRVVNPVLFSLVGLIVPTVAKVHAEVGFRAGRRVGLKYAGAGGAVVAAYFIVLLAAPELLLHLLYPPEYAGVAMGVRLFAVTGMLGIAATLLLAVLNGLGRSRAQFASQTANVIASLLVGLPLTYAYGLWGALWGGLIATIAYAGAAAWQFRRGH